MKSTLSLFDLDKTLVPFNGNELYPQAIDLLKEAAEHGPIAICTNQGGPACRDAGWGDKFPTVEDVAWRLIKIRDRIEKLTGQRVFIYYCLVYKNKDGQLMWPEFLSHYGTDNYDPPIPGQADPNWRKPNPGMILQAMKDFGAIPTMTTMYGDSADDEGAALSAGVKFVKVGFARSD